ncbi:MAG TPA: glycosyl hydrolase family 5, partial [Blastocatellia bacterium]|nr:glycosyl hydrolase family 5 [Blastocatellia bacterium]
IREVDRNHIIFLGGAQWDTNFKVFGTPFDDKVAYTFHKYWMDVNQQAIQEYLDFRDKHNVPVWMGESGENTDEWIGSFRTLLELNNIGWCFWPYK